ncbi:MAG: phage major tail protein, TP901-1 family [Pseudomonadota bacterium]
MVAQRGRDLLLKVDPERNGTYVTIAGLRTRTLAFNAESVDITHSESAGHWRELLAGCGVRSARVAGSGLFKVAQSDEVLRAAFFAGTLLACELAIPDFGSIAGEFHIAALEFAGRHDGEVTFEVALESAGALTFTAVP